MGPPHAKISTGNPEGCGNYFIKGKILSGSYFFRGWPGFAIPIIKDAFVRAVVQVVTILTQSGGWTCVSWTCRSSMGLWITPKTPFFLPHIFELVSWCWNKIILFHVLHCIRCHWATKDARYMLWIPTRRLGQDAVILQCVNFSTKRRQSLCFSRRILVYTSNSGPIPIGSICRYRSCRTIL